MKNNDVLKKVLEFNKAAFENAYTTIAAAQGEAKKATEQLLEKISFIPEEGKAYTLKYFEATKEAGEKFRQAVLKGHEQIETYIVGL
jgi:alcohol dehydrogenase class IV